MYNRLKGKMDLIEVVLFKTLPLLSYTLPAIQNVSQEIFRDGKHINTVYPYGQVSSSSIKVRNGDVIYRVKLLPQIYTLAGNLTTRDNYMYVYDLMLELQVNDSYRLVQRYIQQIDPVDWIVTRFKELLQDYAARLDHDKVASTEFTLDTWNNAISDSGVKISQIYKFTFFLDTKIKKASIQVKADIQRLEDQQSRELDAEQKDYTRREKMKQKNFDHEEENVQQMHILHMRLRAIAAEEIEIILRDRIRDAYDRGEEIGEVAEEAMKLLNAFHESLQRGAIVDANPFRSNIQEQSEDMPASMSTNHIDSITPLAAKQAQEGQTPTGPNIQKM